MPNRPTLNPAEAPPGYFAVLKPSSELGNICRACDWRPECQKSNSTDFTAPGHRCMGYAVICTATGQLVERKDGCSVVFKRLPKESS